MKHIDLSGSDIHRTLQYLPVAIVVGPIVILHSYLTMYRMIFVAILAAVALFDGAAHSAGAGPFSSPWIQNTYSAVRLVAGSTQSDGSQMIGVQIKLQPGWKTYWRVPGESGVPPQFSWHGSTNMKSAEVLWPAPFRFHDEFGSSIGYETEVVLPVLVTRQDPKAPVAIKLVLQYAVCKDLCLPAEAEVGLNLSTRPGSSQFASLIASYQRRVPQPPSNVPGLIVQHVEVQKAASGWDLIVEVNCEDAQRDMVLLIEGPPEFYFGEARAIATEKPGIKRFLSPIDGLKAAEQLSRQELVITVLDGEKRLGQTVRVP